MELIKLTNWFGSPLLGGGGVPVLLPRKAVLFHSTRGPPPISGSQYSRWLFASGMSSTPLGIAPGTNRIPSLSWCHDVIVVGNLINRWTLFPPRSYGVYPQSRGQSGIWIPSATENRRNAEINRVVAWIRFCSVRPLSTCRIRTATTSTTVFLSIGQPNANNNLTRL